MSADYTITEFCQTHNACKSGRDWAMQNCQTMQEVWQKASPQDLIWVAIRKGVLTDKELRLFAVFCARQNQHLLTDPRSLAAIEVAEKYAMGDATDAELSDAADRAAAAADADADAADAARAAARAAAAAAARAAAAAAAARAAARAAAAAAAAAAADAAARAAAADARAAAAARATQVGYLLKNTMPNFSK